MLILLESNENFIFNQNRFIHYVNAIKEISKYGDTLGGYFRFSNKE